MAVVIHHGPNGSFKSFGIVQRFAIPALIAGRTVITNIKGFDDIDRICEVMQIEIPEQAELLYIDTQGNDANKEMLSKWFHWAPFGALLVIDECQVIFREGRGGFDPDSVTIRPSDGVEPVSYINSEGTELLIDRPTTIWESFERHRHFEWDVFLCSPNIGKIHKQLRLNTEFAYRHREMTGVLPWKIKPCWREVQHDPENNGKSITHVLQKKDFKADPRIWSCYQSTETGTHRKSPAKLQIFKDPKLIGLFALVAFAGITGVSLLTSYLEMRSASRESNIVAPEKSDSEVATFLPSRIPVRESRSDIAVHSDAAIVAIQSLSFELRRITGLSTSGRKKTYLFEAEDGDDKYTVSSDDLSMMGFIVFPINDCMARVVLGDQSFMVVCRSVHQIPDEKPSEIIDPNMQMFAGN